MNETGKQLNFGVEVTFGKRKGNFDGAVTNGIVVRDLRVALDIEKTLEPEPDTCKLFLYNASADIRKAIAEENVTCSLAAGYDGNRESLFAGDVTWQRSRLQGTEWVTEVQVGDGTRAYKEAKVSKSFKAGVTLETALKEVVAQMGLRLPRNFTGPELKAQFSAGLTLHGPAHKILTNLLNSRPARSKKDRFSWVIQDGVLQILRDSEVKRGNALLVSQDNGLVGVPESGSVPEKGKPPTIGFQTLLNPALVPGGLVQLDSISTKGSFKLLRVAHAGDTEGDSRTSSCEAAPR